MAKTSDWKKAGFTQVELIVVIGIGALLALWVLPTLARPKRYGGAIRISCVNNLKQLGIAYRVFATDNNDLMPAQAGGANGWKDFLTNGNAGAFCWTNYAIMHTELGESPKVVCCPADERQSASDFGQTNKPVFNNKAVSYFVGVGANENFPQSILGGDRNLCAGLQPDNKYGFSPDSGLGNDINISTNSKISPLSWSRKIHSGTSWPAGAGNLLFADGSVQQCTSAQLRQYQAAALDSGNWASNNIPKNSSFRLVFP